MDEKSAVQSSASAWLCYAICNHALNMKTHSSIAKTLFALIASYANQ